MTQLNKKAMISVLPGWIKAPLRRARNFLRSIIYHGSGRWCPVCGRESRSFHTFGLIPRDEAQCVHCGALERHRFVWLYFKKETDLFDGRNRKMLHVAPEECFEHRLRECLGNNYFTADLLNPRAMVKMDI